MKTQLAQTKQLSLLETQDVSGGMSTHPALGAPLDPHNAHIWPEQPCFTNILQGEYITLAAHENGGEAPFIF
jgi:hypothetical protein